MSGRVRACGGRFVRNGRRPTLRLLVVGDVMLGRLVNEAMRGRPPDWVWGDTLELLKSADWLAGNLECVFTGRTEPAFPDKAFHFRSDAGNVQALKSAGFDAVSLANNHVLDFGDEALLEMLELLDGAGIGHAGAGRNLASASRPAISDIAGFRIGLVAATDNEPDWAAGKGRPGVLYVPAAVESAAVREQLLPAVKAARRQVDLLVVSLHWGPNWGYRAPLGHRSLASALLESGADVVFGHSAHVFRGVAITGGRPVIYSAGDFVDDYAVNEVERNDQSLIFVLEVDGPRVLRLRLRPTVIAHGQARLATGSRARQILRKARELSEAEGTRVELSRDEGLIRLA